MTSDDLQVAIMRSLASSGFRFSMAEFASVDPFEEHTRTEKTLRVISKGGSHPGLEILSAVTGVSIPLHLDTFELDPHFKGGIVSAVMDKLRDVALFTGLKFGLGQPVLCTVIDGTDLDPAALPPIMDVVEGATLDMIGTTARLAYGVKGGSYAVALFVFETPPPPELVQAIAMQKRHQFWKKTWALGWSVDASKGVVYPHNGLPVSTFLLKSGALQSGIFGNYSG